jgi:hypothetical protein
MEIVSFNPMPEFEVQFPIIADVLGTSLRSISRLPFGIPNLGTYGKHMCSLSMSLIAIDLL